MACFGIILWEMLSGESILTNDNNKMTEALLQTLVFDLQDDLLAVVDHLQNATKDIIIKCWTPDPRERPKMEEVLKDLETLNATYEGSSSASDSQTAAGDRATRLQREEEYKRVITGGYVYTKSDYGDGTSVLPSRGRGRNSSWDHVIFDDRDGNPFDALANYEKRYPGAAGRRETSERARRLLNYRKCINVMNSLEAARNPSLWTSDAYHFCKPGINLFRRKEAFDVFGATIMSELDKGFSPAVRCQNVDDIFDALTKSYRGMSSDFGVPTVKESHLRLVLSYRHVHPRLRQQGGWPHRQRIPESGYRKVAHRISNYACSIRAKTVSIWTDQHFAGAQTSDSWANNCLLPYAIYPVVYHEEGDRNETRLWICAEHQLALSGEGIVAEVDELPGVWRKSSRNAVAGKLLPLVRGLVESSSCLLTDISSKETYHKDDRDEIISWAKALAFLGYSRDIWVDYKDMDFHSVSSEIADAVLKQGFSPTWIWVCRRERWEEGAVLRTSNRIIRGEITDRKGWHGLWDWIGMHMDYEDESEIFATVQVENYTRVTTISSDFGMYGFVFLIGVAGQICRCAVVRLCIKGRPVHVEEAFVMSDYDFTLHSISLQDIACMKVSTEEEGAMDLGFVLPKLAEKPGKMFPSERIGRPSHDAVNYVLDAVGMPCVGENISFSFFNGYEIDWD